MINRSALRRLVWFLLFALILASCSEGTDDESGAPRSASSEVDSNGSPRDDDDSDDGFANGEWVQDFWVFEQIMTVDGEGETVDLSDAVVENLQSPDETFELPNDAVFHVFHSLNPSITNADGEDRNDVDTVAGVLEFDGMSALAVLATPTPTAVRPIGLTDNVEVDLDHIEDLLTQDAPLVVDFAFAQARPALTEPQATGLELFARRLSNGQARYLAQTIDGIEQAGTQNALGATTAMTSRMTIGGKGKISDPGLDGMREGWNKCTRRVGPRCVRGYFDSTVRGAAKSNDLLKCNLGGECDDEPGDEDEPDNDPSPGDEAPGNGGPDGNPIPGDDGSGNGDGGSGNGGSNSDGTGNGPGGAGGGTENDIPWCGSMCTVTTGPPATVSGDPHLRSFDGQSFDMQGVGEYVLTEGPLLRAHMRTEPVSEGARNISSVSMIGIEVANNTIVVEAPERQVVVRVDGEEIAYDPARELVTIVELDDDITLFIEPNSVIVSDPTNEMGVVVRNDSGRWLNTSFHVPDTFVDLEGLLGDHDGETHNDFRARDGSLVDVDATPEEFYSKFAHTWRITQDESLLHYQGTESTESWTNAEFPYFDEPGPTEQQLRRGEALCRLAGVTDEALLSECAFDYAMSADIGFVRSAQAAETIEERVGVITEIAALESSRGDDTEGQRTEHTESELEESWRFTPGPQDAGTEIVHECLPSGQFHTVWGGNDGIYTSDSSVCTAAVHAGLITKERGGTVKVTMSEGLDEYGLGTESNGVVTSDWERPWSGSYRLEEE